MALKLTHCVGWCRSLQQSLWRVWRRLSGNSVNDRPCVSAHLHGLRPHKLSNGSLRVVKTLQESGFEAYIVGGAVRDLLLNVNPKDFDVATNATPEEVKSCFRRARLIGRRFRIVHVYMGRECIEVTTFRGDGGEKTDQHGRVIDDNAFGDLAEDARRRDFTINALYYDPVGQVIVDYFHGVSDLQSRLLKVIGEPVQRYREDPVRMLRALRLSAKLGLDIHKTALAPITDMGEMLKHVPSARLFDEILKFLTCGAAEQGVKKLQDAGLHNYLLPVVDRDAKLQSQSERFVNLALRSADERVSQGKFLSGSFLFAALLWQDALLEWNRLQAAGKLIMPALFEAMDIALDKQSGRLLMTRRIVGEIKEIWMLQPRFEQRSGKRPYRLLEHARFRAAYDFLLLRAESGEIDSELANWWQRFQSVDGEERAAMLLPYNKPGSSNRRRVRKKKTTRPVNDLPETA